MKFLKKMPALLAAAAIIFSLLSSCASSKGTAEMEGEALGGGKASYDRQDFFQPESFLEIDSAFGEWTVKTSVPKAALYVNGEYHGLTPLKASGLVPGRYFIQVKKKGFKDVDILIQVKSGVSDFYYLEMEEAEVGESKANGESETIPQGQRPAEPEP